MKYYVWKENWFTRRWVVRQILWIVKSLANGSLRLRGWYISIFKEEREVRNRWSSAYTDDKFNKSYEVVSRNANFILVTNGILLSFLLASQDKGLLNPIVKLADISIDTSWGSIYNVTSSFTPVVPFYYELMYIIIYGAIFTSMISCFGCFNAGLHPQMGRRRIVQELIQREGQAIRWYRRAIISLFLSFLAILNLNYASIVGLSWKVYVLTGLLMGAYLVAVFLLGVFSRFGEDEVSALLDDGWDDG